MWKDNRIYVPYARFLHLPHTKQMKGATNGITICNYCHQVYGMYHDCPAFLGWRKDVDMMAEMEKMEKTFWERWNKANPDTLNGRIKI